MFCFLLQAPVLVSAYTLAQSTLFCLSFSLLRSETSALMVAFSSCDESFPSCYGNVNGFVNPFGERIASSCLDSKMETDLSHICISNTLSPVQHS